MMHLDRARQLVQTIRESVGAARSAIVEAYQWRAWEPLGYSSWDELCDAEFGVRLALGREERVEAVTELRDAGLSTRAIGTALGIHKDTVRNDLAGGEYSPPGPVRGLDGKTYRPPARPDIPTPLADELAARNRLVARLAGLWSHETSNLIQAMRDAADDARLRDSLAADDDPLGNRADRHIARLRDLSAAAAHLADVLAGRPTMRRIQ
jgi:hypothetical protein